jgi:spermidine synthase
MHPVALKEIRLAFQLFTASLIFLSLGASIGLNSWPGSFLLGTIANPTLRGIFLFFSALGLIAVATFWGSLPGIRAQRAVLIAWPITTVVLWLILRNEAKIGWFSDADVDILTLVITGMGIPALAALVWRALHARCNPDNAVESGLRWLLIMSFMFIMVPQSALDFTVTLHPKTYDLFALKFDAAAGWNIVPWLVDTVDAALGAKEVLGLAYRLTPMAFLVLALLQLRHRPSHVPNALLLWVGMSICALIAYHLFPITGPKYVFGSDHFLAKLRTPDILPLELTVGMGPNPRNGMPSMHFGWMFGAFVVCLMSDTRRWSRSILGFVTVCVALATLYLGEHYVIDLIVAVPFVLACIAMTSTRVPWHVPERWWTVALGIGCWLVWVICLRTQIEFFIKFPWACWLLLAVTIAVVVQQVRALSRFRSLAESVTQVSGIGDRHAVPESNVRLVRQMGFMFFASGAAALVYQVLFAKELALVFGSTATATFTVLATFLGGMALGSLIGGAIAARTTRPVVLYAFVELAIGIFCIATPTLFSAIQAAYVFLAADISPASPALLALRVALGAGVLLVPTVLMGITLPLLSHALNPRGDMLGKSVAWLYVCNTAGAALGALATSYLIIPTLGAHSTTLVAAVLNMLVALGALELAKKPELASRILTADEVHHPHVMPDNSTSNSFRMLIGAWLALGLGGILSLGLEVVYVHLLSIVAGNSVYAFGLMLATFLIGLAIGGECGRRIIERSGTERAAWLAATQLALAATVVLGSWGWDMIPAYFAGFEGFPLTGSFASREAIRGLVCALVMIPPTIFIGTSYTLAMDLVTTASTRPGITMLGMGAALNTLGNIVGVFLFGFVVLPLLSGLIAIKIIAAGALAVAVFVTGAVTSRSVRRWLGAVSLGTIGLLAVSPRQLDYQLLSSGANVYFSAQNWGKVIDHAESIDGGLTTVARQTLNQDVITTLLTNGKFQGNDAQKGEVQAQIGFAALPLLHQGRRDNALVIGYGTGATSRVLHDAGFENIDIAELSHDVVKLADTYFSGINRKVSGQHGVQTHITDGRNLLLLTGRRYDIISIEITSIWFAGAASLYNREFYQLARSKLQPDGVLQQWVQLHHMAPTDLLTIVATLRSEFAFVSFYVVGGQGILIATNDSERAQPSPAIIAELDSSNQLQPLRELAGRSFADIAKDLLLSPHQVDDFIDRVGLSRELWISTDNNLKLEYNTPKANANMHDRSMQINMELLRASQHK